MLSLSRRIRIGFLRFLAFEKLALSGYSGGNYYRDVLVAYSRYTAPSASEADPK